MNINSSKGSGFSFYGTHNNVACIRGQKLIYTRNLARFGRLPKGFTLIELLIVIGIIALLLSILLGSLSHARWTTYRVICSSNLRQCVIGCLAYAVDHNDTVPPGFYDRLPASVYWSPYRDYNLPQMIEPYVGNAMTVWHCASINTFAPPPSDPSNSRLNHRYCTYLYFPGRKYPAFGDPDKAVPVRIGNARPNQPLIQDQMTYFGPTHIHVEYRGYWCNHARGGRRVVRYDMNNPSNAYFIVQDGQDVVGGNIGFFDGSVRWVGVNKLRDVGLRTDPSVTTSGRDSAVLSVMPQ